MLLVADFCNNIFSILDTEDMTLEAIKYNDLLRVMKNGFQLDNIHTKYLMLIDIYGYDFQSFNSLAYSDGKKIHLGNLYTYFKSHDTMYCDKNYGIRFKVFDSNDIAIDIYINGMRYECNWYHQTGTPMGASINDTILSMVKRPRYIGYCKNISSVILGMDDMCLAFTGYGVYKTDRSLLGKFGMKVGSGISCTMAGFKRCLLNRE